MPLSTLAVVGTGTLLFLWRRARKPQVNNPGNAGNARLSSVATKVRKISDALRSNQRQRLMEKLTSRVVKVSDEERKINRGLVVSTVGLGAAFASFVFPPAYLIVVGSVCYSVIPIYQHAYQEALVERRVSTSLLTVCFCTGLFIMGEFRLVLLFNSLSLLSRKLLILSENRTQSGMVNLFGEQPQTAWVVLDDDTEIEIPFEKLTTGDRVVVRAGQVIPVDGVIEHGEASIDQHGLTGESNPVERSVGDAVFAATILRSGRVYVRVEQSGADTVAMKIAKALQDTADYQSSIQTRGKAFADRSVLPTLGLAGIFWPLLSFQAGVAVLASTFGFNMRLFGPASLLSFLSIAAQNKILIKDGRALETLSEIDTIVFDKTGTLTVEEPSVTEIIAVSGFMEDDVLAYAAAAEHGQSHPIARAITNAAQSRACHLPASGESHYVFGFGILVELDEGIVRVGSLRFMDEEGINVDESLRDAHTRAQTQGASVVFVALDQQAIGIITLEATLRLGVKQAIEVLQARGLSLIILSGDHDTPTRKLAEKVGIDAFFSETLPEDKAAIVERFTSEGRRVCFVGDGFNDSIAMKKAHVSISLRGATTIATDTAQIILMDAHLEQLCTLFDLVDRLNANMKVNFIMATVPSVVSALGIIFLKWATGAAVALAIFSLVGGITNSLWPLLTKEGDPEDEEVGSSRPALPPVSSNQSV